VRGGETRRFIPVCTTGARPPTGFSGGAMTVANQGRVQPNVDEGGEGTLWAANSQELYKENLGKTQLKAQGEKREYVEGKLKKLRGGVGRKKSLAAKRKQRKKEAIVGESHRKSGSV